MNKGCYKVHLVPKADLYPPQKEEINALLAEYSDTLYLLWEGDMIYVLPRNNTDNRDHAMSFWYGLVHLADYFEVYELLDMTVEERQRLLEAQ